MRRRATAIAILLAATALVTAVAHLDAAPPEWRVQRVPGLARDVQHADVADLDGDGLADLWAADAGGVLAWLSSPDRGPDLSGRPSRMATFANLDTGDVVGWEVADVAGGPGAELVVFGPQGVAALTFAAPGADPGPPLASVTWDAVEAAGGGPVLLRLAAGAEPTRLPLVRDLTGDGRADVLVPQAGGLRVLRNDPDGLVPAGLVPVRGGGSARVSDGPLHRATGGAWLGGVLFPETLPGTVATAADGDLTLHRPGPDGPIPAGTWRLPPGATGGRVVEGDIDRDSDEGRPEDGDDADEDDDRAPESGRRDRADFESSYAGPVVEDLDGDGRPDVAVTDLADGRVRIHRMHADGYRDEADQVLEAGGWVFGVRARDLDGDGATDLVVPRMEAIGLLDVLRILFSRELDFAVHGWRNNGDGTFPEEPSFERSMTLALDLGGGRDGMAAGLRLVAHLGADLNGDGRRDLVIEDGGDDLAIHAGRADGGLESRPFAVVTVPGLGDARTVDLASGDLTGDGRDELIVIARGREAGGDRVTLVTAPAEDR